METEPELETGISLSIGRCTKCIGGDRGMIHLSLKLPIDERSEAFYNNVSELDGSEDLQEIEVWALGGLLQKLVAPEW